MIVMRLCFDAPPPVETAQDSALSVWCGWRLDGRGGGGCRERVAGLLLGHLDDIIVGDRHGLSGRLLVNLDRESSAGTDGETVARGVEAVPQVGLAPLAHHAHAPLEEGGGSLGCGQRLILVLVERLLIALASIGINAQERGSLFRGEVGDGAGPWR